MGTKEGDKRDMATTLIRYCRHCKMRSKCEIREPIIRRTAVRNRANVTADVYLALECAKCHQIVAQQVGKLVAPWPEDAGDHPQGEINPRSGCTHGLGTSLSLAPYGGRGTCTWCREGPALLVKLDVDVLCACSSHSRFPVVLTGTFPLPGSGDT